MPYGDDIIAICQAFQRDQPFVMGHAGDRSGPKTKVTARPGPLSERVALVPICQTRRPSAKTLRYGAELAENRNGRLSSLRVKDIDQIGLLPEQVPGTILVGRRTDEIVRADRPGPAHGASGGSARRLGCDVGPRGRVLARPRQPAAPRPAPEVR